MDVVNSKILLNLEYPDIINACQALPAFARVCNDPYFWDLKAEDDFGIPSSELALVPGSSNQERYKFIYDIKDPNKGLLEAANLGVLSLVKYFLKLGADLHAEDEFVLRLAVAKGHLGVVKYLVEQGANIHAKGELALKWATDYNHLDVVKYLVEQGSKNDEALSLANEYGRLDIVKYLTGESTRSKID